MYAENVYCFKSKYIKYIKYIIFLCFVLGPRTSSSECSDIYHGKSPFSEIEVKQVSDFLEKLTKTVGLKSHWNVHAYGQMLLYPWSYKTDAAEDETEIVSHVESLKINYFSQIS